MKVRVLAIGRLKEEYLARAEGEYVKRMRPFCRLSIDEYRDEAALLSALPPRCFLVALDERGDQMTSQEFAKGVVGNCAESARELVFAIGGADGHSEELRKRANLLLAFGKMTIAHRIARLVLLEQIYRAFTILRGHPYHR